MVQKGFMLEINNIYQGDCTDLLKQLDDNSIDSIVTDPPYGWSFMGKKWDYDIPSIDIWQECLRVLKPGGHILSACGTRTYHRMAVAIEDAGFEIRDIIAYIYGSGFPKSLNIGKAVDKMTGNERKVIGTKETGADKPNGKGTLQLSKNTFTDEYGKTVFNLTKGNSPYEGYGTALKPAMELFCLARKPLSENNIASNVMKWGTGGINIDGCRVETDDNLAKEWNRNQSKSADKSYSGKYGDINLNAYKQTARFPANIIHDGSDDVVGLFPNVKTGNIKPHEQNLNKDLIQFNKAEEITSSFIGDNGSAARFFYCAKASKAERNMGCEGLECNEENLQGLDTRGRTLVREDGSKTLVERWKGTPSANNHPTVKPIALMKYLCRLITPPQGIVLDPFAGSGSTLIAAKQEGFNYIGFELEPEYIEIARARLNYDKQLCFSVR